MRRKRGIWDGTCWRFRHRSKRSVTSACYEVEGIGSVHAPDTVVQIPAVASDVLICNQVFLRGVYGFILEGFERMLPDFAGLAKYLTRYGLENCPVLLNGCMLFPNLEMLRLYANAAVHMPPFGCLWRVGRDEIQAKFGGHLCTYVNPQPHRAGILIKSLVFTDQVRGMLAATVADIDHPAARRLGAACADLPTLASAVEHALDQPGDDEALESLRVIWAICR